MHKKILYPMMLVLLAQTGFAQVANYEFFAFRNGNMFSVNPAWVTKDDAIHVVVSGQTMSSVVSYGHKNLMAGVYAGVGNNSGLGLKVVSDTRGAFQVLRADLTYGFHARFTGGHSLHMGALMGINNSNLNISRIENYELIDPNDPTLSSSYYNATQFVAGAGILYSYKKFDLSVSLPQIVSTGQPFNSYIHAAAFYQIKSGQDFTFQPWVSYQRMPVTPSLVGGYVKTTYKDRMWLQAGYQNNKSVSAAFGMKFDNIGIAYGYRTASAEFRQAGGQMHEVTFAIAVQRKPKVSKVSGTDPLAGILKHLDKLLAQQLTDQNREEFQAELERIKVMLSNAEIDNSDPKKAKHVEKQLILIEEKLRILEQKLYP
jgi:type IX secretion system PorP/SprF family membrane protein